MKEPTFQLAKGNKTPIKKSAAVGPPAADEKVMIDWITVPPKTLTAKARAVEVTPNIVTEEMKDVHLMSLTSIMCGVSWLRQQNCQTCL